MKIGVFGGTFNPIHNGHIMLAKYCKNSVGLDRVMLIPTAVPPHKISTDLASEQDRLNMCSLACKNNDGFYVSDIEIQRKGKSYTYETLAQLKRMYPDDELFLIMGADMFLTLDKWKNPKEIFKNSSIITLPRNSDGKAELEKFYKDVLIDLGAKAVILPEPVITVSSTFVRENIEDYRFLKKLIDKNVYDYIIKNNLYRK